MKKKLLATVAVATVVGFGGVAAAQSPMGGESNKATPSVTPEKSGGSMNGVQPGSKTLSPSSSRSSNPSSSQSAQTMEKRGKDNERLGQSPNEEQKNMTRGAQQEKRGMEQNSAQQERGTNLKGAQAQRGTNLKGAQEQRGTTDRTGLNTNVGDRGGSVRLSEDQRSHIKTVIEREHGPRLDRNLNFSVSVGTRIPRNVHVVVLPEDIVRIVPQYRGFAYFLVEDEIVIVDPQTLEIVAVIPA